MERTIEELRREIDSVDRQLVELLKARMELSGQVADYKKENGLPVLVPEREQSLLTRVSEQAGETCSGFVREVYQLILSHSRACQMEKGCGRFGLIGERLVHSFSPAIHSQLGGYSYELFELKPEELEDFLHSGVFDGLNVTIPYKKTVIPFCQELTDQAARIGSVNTIVRRPDGTLLGHNTDYDGFVHLLRTVGADVAGKKVLVLGSGGASLTVQTVLHDLGAGQVVVISRSGPDNYDNLDRHADAQYLVNTTPVGMYPNNGKSPVDLHDFPALEGVFDLVYNPARTKLLLDAEILRIPCRGGLPMLVAQARAAAEMFLNQSIPDERVEEITARLGRATRNVLLIGMPGCGKSTVGRVLAKKLGRPIYDLDSMVEEQAGCTIPRIFEEQGENAFRVLEHETLCRVSKLSGGVIACGGGIVTRRENLYPMRENSVVVLLRRPLEQLAIVGRPLSTADGLPDLYRRRMPLYEAAADLIVDNTTVEAAAEEIIGRIGL